MDEELDLNHFELDLYEKKRLKKRKKRTWFIFFGGVLFLSLCAVPVYRERAPKWKSLSVARQLAMELERMKTKSIEVQVPLRMVVGDTGIVKIEKIGSCEANQEASRDGITNEKEFLIDPKNETTMFPVRETKQICFDPVHGWVSPQKKLTLIFVPVKDLSEQRMDRASYLEIQDQTINIVIN